MFKPTSLAVITLLAFGAAQAQPVNKDFDLINDTNSTITGIWLSTYGDRTWHGLSGDTVRPGGRTHITIKSPDPRRCTEQLRVKFYGISTHYEWMDGFDLCTLRAIRIYFEPLDGSVQASYTHF